MPGRQLDTLAASTHMPAWQVQMQARTKRTVHNNPTPSARSESLGYRRPMYCAQCDRRMPDGDVGLCCPMCRAAVLPR